MERNPNLSNKSVKHKLKDNLFSFLFGDIKYLRQLYAALHPEDTDLSDEDFEIITLENIMVNHVYNDLGILVKDKLIILVEAQSSYNPNMAIRYLIYIANTYYNYVLDRKLNIFGTTKVKLPKPEFYLIYTGQREFEEKELRFSDSYMERESSDYDGKKEGGKADDLPLELRVRIISRQDEEHNILTEYITFCQIYDIESRGADTKEKRMEALKRTIRLCKERNILKDFLAQREREVHEVMMQVFTQEQAMELVLAEKYMEGRQEGRQEGKLEGRQEGRQEGRREEALGMAKKMKNMGYSEEEIYKLTGIRL